MIFNFFLTMFVLLPAILYSLGLFVDSLSSDEGSDKYHNLTEQERKDLEK